jgi:hypothetical protein
LRFFAIGLITSTCAGVDTPKLFDLRAEQSLKNI